MSAFKTEMPVFKTEMPAFVFPAFALLGKQQILSFRGWGVSMPVGPKNVCPRAKSNEGPSDRQVSTLTTTP